MESTFDDVQRIAYLSSGQIIYAVHKSTQCNGKVCPLHKPSEHIFRDFPLKYEANAGHFFRDVFGVSILDPDDYILNRDGYAIIKNAASCTVCYSFIESKHRHDFKSCSCGNIFVDGGLSYLRRGGNMSTFQDESKIVHLSDYKLLCYN